MLGAQAAGYVLKREGGSGSHLELTGILVILEVGRKLKMDLRRKFLLSVFHVLFFYSINKLGIRSGEILSY